MKLSLDLTPRQMARVLEQAWRNRARLAVEPRNQAAGRCLNGVLETREANLLRIELPNPSDGPMLDSLIGAFCDVHLAISRQLYLFCSCIIDVLDTAAPVRLVLAAPEEMQVINRRRFLRHRLGQAAPVRLWSPAGEGPFTGELFDISREGLACRLARGESQDALLVGDEVRVGLELREPEASFDLPAVVCSKTPLPADPAHWLLGVEFLQRPESQEAFENFCAVFGGMITQSLRTEKDA